MNKIKTIGLVFDSRNKEAKKAAFETAEWLKENGIAVTVYSSRENIGENFDLVVTFGGDGTVLHVANKVLKYQTPILRVNFGTRGCLCNIAKKDVYSALDKVLGGKFYLESRTRIRARNRTGFEVDALNEILVGGNNYRNVWLEVKFGEGADIKIFRATGDGLLFVTKNGSTAWNSNAGGPQLLTDVFCVTGSNAEFESKPDWVSSKVKSLVVPVETVFKVRTLRSGPYLPYVVADSQRHYRFKKDEVIFVEKSLYKTLFMELK